MEKIKDFRINLNSDSLENVKKIKDKVENFVSENDIKNLSFSLSSLLDIPVEVINKKIKQIKSYKPLGNRCIIFSTSDIARGNNNTPIMVIITE